MLKKFMAAILGSLAIMPSARGNGAIYPIDLACLDHGGSKFSIENIAETNSSDEEVEANDARQRFNVRQFVSGIETTAQGVLSSANEILLQSGGFIKIVFLGSGRFTAEVQWDPLTHSQTYSRCGSIRPGSIISN